MHMAPAAAPRGVCALSNSNPFFLSRPGDAAAAPATVRFSRRNGGKGAVLCLASGGGPPDGEQEPTGSSWDGRLVDEDMATLRRRIREASAAYDPNDDDEEDGGVGVEALPAEWTELERRHHGSYVAGVRDAVGVLQAFLISTRPGLAAGVVALVLLGVPALALLVSAQLIRAVDSISSAVLNGGM